MESKKRKRVDEDHKDHEEDHDAIHLEMSKFLKKLEDGTIKLDHSSFSKEMEKVDKYKEMLEEIKRSCEKNLVGKMPNKKIKVEDEPIKVEGFPDWPDHDLKSNEKEILDNMNGCLDGKLTTGLDVVKDIQDWHCVNVRCYGEGECSVLINADELLNASAAIIKVRAIQGLGEDGEVEENGEFRLMGWKGGDLSILVSLVQIMFSAFSALQKRQRKH